MANRIATLLGNAKTRTLVLIVVGILIFGVVIAVSQSDSTTDTAVTERVSKTTEVPTNVRSTPGEQVSRRYQELQEQANVRGAQEAAEKGETFIPTLVGAAEGYDDTDFEKQLSAAFDDLGGKCSKEEIARLKAQGMATPEIVLQLKCYGCSAEAIGSLFACNDITSALLATKGCPGGDIAGCNADAVKEMQKLGYDAAKIAATMKENRCKPEDVAKSMKEAGINGADVAKAMKDAGYTSNEIAKAMKDAGYSSAEIAAGLKAAGVSADEIANALKAAGADASEIADALNKAGFDRSEILAALQQAGFDPLEIAKAVSSLEIEGADAAALLAQQQATSDEAKRLAAMQEAQRLAQFSQQRQNKIQELMTAMEAQKATVMQSWETVAEQSFVEGEWAALRPTPQQVVAASGGGTGTGSDEERPVILKAGSILFAVLDTAVNSDEPGPVMATVVSGTLKNSKLLGTMQVNTDGENISLNFTAINMPGEAKSMGISAVAIDPDTARTALASDVDHHYLLRWGSLFASAFMEGYASAVASSGTTQTVSQGAAGTVTTTTAPPLDGRQQLFQGLAAVGTKWSEVVGRNFDRPITITIDQGTGIGVLVTSDLEFGTDPIYYTPPTTTTAAATQQAPQPGAAAGAAQGTIGNAGVTPEQAAAFLNALQTASVPPAAGAQAAPAPTTGGTQ